ncbi:TPR repeat-containing protein, partial [Listeria monocytogenes FSL F2-208]
MLVRKGIRLKIEESVQLELKTAFKDYAKWLRKEYDFPIRVPVYVKAKKKITTINKAEV